MDQPNEGLRVFGTVAGIGRAGGRSWFRDYLKNYVNAFRAIGAKPILISSVTRRKFDERGKIKSTLTPWAEASKAVAAELKVPFLDLHAASIDYHDRIGSEASMGFNPKPGDTTHFNTKGADAITDLIVHELKQSVKDLAGYLE